MQENKPMLIVGLGNPGPEYALNRHNVGFMAIDYFAGAGASWKKEKNALTFGTDLDGHKVIFVKPQTFMNNSGIAVQALMHFYKIPLENLIVIHDDMDIKPGSFRKKTGGSSAGHNGIKSIDASVGADYQRIRIGIGHPKDFNLQMSPSDWVVSNFSKAELETISKVIPEINIFD